MRTASPTPSAPAATAPSRRGRPRKPPALPGLSGQWNDRMAFEFALALEGSGEPVPDILDRHGFTPDDLPLLKADRTFLRKVSDYREDIRARGLTFRLKARAQAEELLSTSWVMIHDPGVSPTVKADLIKSTVRWAGLDTPQTAASDPSGSGGVRIVIDMGGQHLEVAAAPDPAKPPQPAEIQARTRFIEDPDE